MENQDPSSSSKSPPAATTSKDKRIKLTPAPVACPKKPSKSNIIERRPWLRGLTIEPMQKPKETTSKNKVQHHTRQSDQRANNDGSFLVPKELGKMLQVKKKPHEDGCTDRGNKEFPAGLSKYPNGDWKKKSEITYVKTKNLQKVQEHAEPVSKTHPQSSNVITHTKKRRNTVRDMAKSSSSSANNATSSAKIDSTSKYPVPVASNSSSSTLINNANIVSTSSHLVPTSSYQVPLAAATVIASSGTNVADQSAIFSMANRFEVDITGQCPIETLDLFPTAPPRPTLIMFPVAQPYFPVRPQIRSSGTAVPEHLYGSNLYSTVTITPNFSPSYVELDLDLRLG